MYISGYFIEKTNDIYYTNYMYKTSAKLKKMESKTVQTTPAKKGK